MTNIKLLLKNIHGETVEESTIALTNDDTLLVSHPKEMNLEVAHKFYEIIKKSLENEAKFLMLPEGITLKVLSKTTQK
ncbi:hypothetical protein ACQKNX_07515 [Lysinibacillus sp. NPDC093712]|uniref:hypothetical protein n=1 Tax=Lysinibacillus sp. NPDC093712 TaxID=3390579 RepID=UPI003D03375A